MSRPALPPYHPTGDVPADKAHWRAQVRAARRDLVGGWTPATRAAHADALARAGTALAYAVAADRNGSARLAGQTGSPGGRSLAGLTVTAFEPMRTEPPLERLTEELRGAGARVLVPLTLARPRLDWADLDDPDRTPLGEVTLAQVGLALIPGLAISEAGVRLGQGGGYYDHTLPRLRALAGEQVPVVVVLHDHEVVPAVPADEHDAVVDGVLRAGSGVVWVSPRPAPAPAPGSAQRPPGPPPE